MERLSTEKLLRRCSMQRRRVKWSFTSKLVHSCALLLVLLLLLDAMMTPRLRS